MKIISLNLGDFEGYNYDYTSFGRILGYEQMNQPQFYSTKEENFDNFFFAITFPMSNSYLIKIPIKQIEATQHYQFMNTMSIAPISNPFIGFMPDSDSLQSRMQGNFMTHLRSYEGQVFFLVYELAVDNMVDIEIKTDKKKLADRTGRTLEDAQMVKNIFAEVGQTPIYKKYISTKAIIPIKQVIPRKYQLFIYKYGQDSLYEHELFFTDIEGNAYRKMFSHKLNIELKTQIVASNFMQIFIQGI